MYVTLPFTLYLHCEQLKLTPFPIQDPSDPISLLSAWLALLPQALCVVYATLLWSHREAEVALMFAGQLACEALNFALKRLIKQERPKRIPLLGKGYGMPSSHAQFAFFWAVSVCLFLLVRHVPKGRATPASAGPAKKNVGDGGVEWAARFRAVEEFAHSPWSLAHRAVAGVCSVAVAGAVAWSRVYLGYHTPAQVAAGVAAGTASAVGWFALTGWVRSSGLLSWALQLPPARWFRIRDLVIEEDLQWAGWEKWEGRRVRALEKKQ